MQLPHQSPQAPAIRAAGFQPHHSAATAFAEMVNRNCLWEQVRDETMELRFVGAADVRPPVS
jgi:hypothetical protein